MLVKKSTIQVRKRKSGLAITSIKGIDPSPTSHKSTPNTIVSSINSRNKLAKTNPTFSDSRNLPGV
jgi:hypothetical protein